MHQALNRPRGRVAPNLAGLEGFQRRFVRAVLSGRYDRLALSLPRGNGKSWTAARLVSLALQPGSPLFQPGNETILCSPSIEQCRIVFKFARRELQASDDYVFQDSANRVGIRHKASGTRLRALGSSGKTAMGVGADTSLLILDEPGALKTAGGELLSDAVDTSLGKAGSDMKAIYIGTQAPATGGWWIDMLENGTDGSTYVQKLIGDPEKWKEWREITRVNPITRISAKFRDKLREERGKARADERLKARFLSYRLNYPAGDPSSVLLNKSDCERIMARPVPPREGQPICAVDLGGGRAWSACLALWRNGRIEAHAVAPGLPSLEDQERRDLVPRGTYSALARAGVLTTDEDRRVPRVGLVVDRLREWQPEAVYSDRARLPEMLDEVNGSMLMVPRVTQWFEASYDIRATRRFAADGPLSVAEVSRGLLLHSLSVTAVRTDGAGNVRIVKKDTNNTSRDDVSSALVLACGALARVPPPAKGANYVIC